jgi:hypothetical protein
MLVAPSSRILSALKMEALRSSETNSVELSTNREAKATSCAAIR